MSGAALGPEPGTTERPVDRAAGPVDGVGPTWMSSVIVGGVWPEASRPGAGAVVVVGEPLQLQRDGREVDDAGYYMQTLSAYMSLQATRPQTIGYSLADSPVGLASWIYAMFQDVGGTPGDAEATFTHDELLDDIMLYWLLNSGASSVRLCWEWAHTAPRPDRGPITLPTGFLMTPRDHIRKSRRWIERRFPALVHFDELDAGGHFAALEQPTGFVASVRATFAGLR